MSAPLLEIQPKELKFICELKKQSSCSISMTNNTDCHVAFKVKTTSPKKYCVRPNVGVIMPKSICEFTVTMQAPRTPPLDFECKDKFLIQSTIVPAGTSDEEITANTFVRNGDKYVEEKKMRVALISPPQSPMLFPINGALKNGHGHEVSIVKGQAFSGVEVPPQHNMIIKDVEESVMVNTEKSKPTEDTELKSGKDLGFKPVKDGKIKPTEDLELKQEKDAGLKPANNVEPKLEKDVVLKPEKDVELNVAKDIELKPEKDVVLKSVKDLNLKPAEDVESLKLIKDIEDMKSKLSELELKLSKAEVTISKLTDEKSSSIEERRILQEALVELRNRGMIQVGFPLLYVCMVALISVALGYRLHA
ncbi:hypothetical protein FNV43_RR04832 [Rhamnella rubrinervis]|uniref:MSP domain-containing protein n=1 Tax=Rhamnella rubrinervis TaxID=2594499 RepID=A0A8K0MR01_9ROSA|nr:hypothetical protein FNV43_RR04832 [Rhamnella rubrinervis]